MTSLQIINQSEEEAPVKTVETLCQICQKQFSNYVCPRCNLRYCSLACYRNGQHADCTESFYKDSVLAEIDSRVDPAQRNQMIETLRRFEAENDEMPTSILTSHDDEHEDQDEEEDEEDIADRLANLDLETADAEALWSRLTPAERREFEELVRNHSTTDIDELLEYSDPWWTIPVAKIAVVLDEDDDSDDGKENGIPALPDTAEAMEASAALYKKKAPHPDLGYHWLSILMAYCHIIRQWMGSIRDDVPATIQCLQEQSILFSPAPIQLSSVQDVLVDLMARGAAGAADGGDSNKSETMALLLEDANKIVSTSDYALRAMADLERLLREAKITGMKKQLFMAEKKASYYLAFTAYLMEHPPLRQKIELETAMERDRIRLEKKVIESTERAARAAVNRQRESKISPSNVIIEQTSNVS